MNASVVVGAPGCERVSDSLGEMRGDEQEGAGGFNISKKK